MKVDLSTNLEMNSTYTKVEVQKNREPNKVETKPEVNKEHEVKQNVEDSKKVEEAVDKINKQLKAANTKIQFRIHESSYSEINKVSIKIIDETNDEVIREIPSEEAIELSEKMHEVIGVLFDKKN